MSLPVVFLWECGFRAQAGRMRWGVGSGERGGTEGSAALDSSLNGSSLVDRANLAGGHVVLPDARPQQTTAQLGLDLDAMLVQVAKARAAPCFNIAKVQVEGVDPPHGT